MKSDKYSLVVLSILLILLLFIGSASAADSNGTDVLSADKSTDTVEKLALDISSDNAVANDTNVLRNNGNDLLSMDNNLKSNELSDDTLKISNDELLTAGNSWYVNSSKTSSGDGKSNETAFQTVSQALGKADRGDTIMIASGEYKGTDNIGLSISYNLNFIKYGDDEAIFDAEGERRIWTFMDWNPVNIIGLTFKNGKSTSNAGGAIYMRGGNVINCTFIDNTATTGDGGGAIYFMREGNVSDCTFTGNTGRIGGAIYFSEEGNVSDCTFTGNKASINAGAVSIINAGSVTNCNFTDNTATKDGGAIYFYDESSAINCNFINNTAKYGGAVVMSKGNVTNCNFTDNTASSDEGGAIYFLSYSNVTNCNFTDNTAGYMGGAITFYGGGSASNCTFTGNNATWWGGAIYFHDDGTVTDCAFVNNYAPNGKAISSSRVLKSIDNNWWGSNNPNWAELINEAGIPSSYAVLNGSADATTIKPGSKAKLTYGFYSNATGDLLSIPSRPIELSATGGHLDDDTGYLVNGEFSTEFSSDALGEFEITATVDNQEVKLTETVAATFWYVNATAAPGGDGKSNETAFQSLKEALTDAENGDIIMIASGTYTGTDNRGLSIDKKLSFEKYGDGEAIFDAQGQNRFWLVEYGVETININGLTFKNGKASYGGAIRINNKLSNSVINATFINNNATTYGGAIYMASGGDNVNISGEFRDNNAPRGGAIYFGTISNFNINAVFINNTASEDGGAICFSSAIDNVNITCDFINNTAEGTGGRCGGGAIAFYTPVTSSFISGNFIGNKALGSADTDGGAALFFFNSMTNVDISGKYINNTGNNVIYFISANTVNVIHDSVFLNNDVSKIFKVDSGNFTAIDNWFGNNATNYDEAPADVGIDLDNWLFLNATADPSEIGVGQSSTIKFKLYNKNSSDTEYDDSKMNIQLDLTQTLGKLDKTAASLGEEITYTAKEVGDASVTATFETASYTLKLKNSGIPTVLNLYRIYPGEYNPSFTVDIGGTVKNNMIGVTIKKGSVKLYLNGENVKNVTVDGDDGSISASLGVLNAGNYTVKVVYHDDTGEFLDCEWNSSFEIKQAPTEITINNASIELIIGNGTIIEAVLNPSEAGNLNYSSNDTSVAVVNENGEITAVGAGTANITVSFEGNNNYAASQNYTVVTVSKIPAEINITQPSIEAGIGGTGQITGAELIPSEAGNLTYSSNDTNVVWVSSDGDFTTYSAGTALITVSFAGNENYTAAESKTITFTVNKWPTNITLKNETFDLKVYDEVPSGAALDPSYAGELNYTSSDESVVKVENGNIKAVGVGQATVTVSFGGARDYEAAENKTIAVTVSFADARVDAEDMELTVDENGTIKYYTTPADLNVTFVPDNSGIVSVDENGTVTALKGGIATITVKVGGDGVYAENSTTVTVTVSKKSVKIDLTEDGYAVYVDDIYDNLAVLQDVDGNNITDEYRLDYTSSDESVVKIVDDSFVAVGEGLATITVSFNGTDKYESADDASFKVGVFKKESSIDIEPKSVEIVAGEDAPITVILPEDATGIVLVDVGDNKYYGDVENGNATVNIAGLTAGNYTAKVIYPGDDKYSEANTTVAVKVDAQPAPKTESSIAIVEVNGYNITGILNDDSGKGIADAQIKYAVNGTEKTVITAKDGSFVIEALPNSPVSIDYAGDNTTEPTKTSITIKEYDVPVPVKLTSEFNITNRAITITGYAVDGPAGEQGIYYATELLDENGNPIKNVYIEFAVNNKIYNRTTYENGSFKPYKLNMVRAGRYTMAFNFAGDDNYTNAFACVCVDLSKKPITIKASSKSYKATTKTKKYTVTLSTIKGLDGKMYLSPKKVSLKVNGKTYTVKTNSKGQVTFKITNLKKKANYKAKISYAGDKTYESASKTVTLKVK